MKQQKEKLRKQSHLKLQQKKKNLGINLTKEVKDPYTENCKIPRKKPNKRGKISVL